MLRTGTPEEAGLRPERIELVRKRCREWVEDGSHTAIAVLVARRGVIALHQAFGRLGPEPDAPATPVDALFGVASISKTFVTTVAMMLVEDGLLGLTRPVQDYVPEFIGDRKDQVCVHHLMTHTSGLTDEDVFPVLLRRLADGVELPPREPTQHPFVHAYMCLTTDVPMTRAPGESMVYSTYNIDLLAEIVRRVTASRFTDLCRDRIFSSVGMSDTFYVLPDEHFPRAVRDPTRSFLGVPVDSREARRTPMASTGAHSTVRDMAVFVQMFLQRGVHNGRRVLSEFSVEEMTRNQIPGIPADAFGQHHAEASWGYAWAIGSHEKWPKFPTLPARTFNHMGGSGALIWGDLDNELVGVFFSTPTRFEQMPESVLEEPLFNADLFANAVYSAVE